MLRKICESCTTLREAEILQLEALECQLPLVAELSGGELQRFCIARALGERTQFILADEISTMLDLITQGQIWHFLMEETYKRQIGMVVASHSRELLDYICTRQVQLAQSVGEPPQAAE